MSANAVKEIGEGAIRLTDGRVIPPQYRAFTYGYALTSHAAQGKTADQVVVLASTRALPAVNQEQFYVSISRGRDSCTVLTDDIEQLRAHAERSSSRKAGIEAIQESPGFFTELLRRGERFLQRFRIQQPEIPIYEQSQQIEPPESTVRRRGISV